MRCTAHYTGYFFGLPMSCALVSTISQYGGNGGIGITAVITWPIIGAIGGFIGGIITGFVYNLVAGWVGGIEMEFDGMDGGDIL